MVMFRRNTLNIIVVLALLTLPFTKPASAASASKLVDSSNAALVNLYALQPKAKLLADKAVGILV